MKTLIHSHSFTATIVLRPQLSHHFLFFKPQTYSELFAASSSKIFNSNQEIIIKSSNYRVVHATKFLDESAVTMPRGYHLYLGTMPCPSVRWHGQGSTRLTILKPRWSQTFSGEYLVLTAVERSTVVLGSPQKESILRLFWIDPAFRWAFIG